MKKGVTSLLLTLSCFTLAACGTKNISTSTGTTKPVATQTTGAKPTNGNTTKPSEGKKTTTGNNTNQEIKDSLVIHYKRFDDDYTEFNSVWVWPKEGSGAAYAFGDNLDSYGAYCVVPLSVLSGVSEAGFIVRTDSWAKDIDADRFIDLGTIEKDGNGCYHIYLVTGDENVYTSATGAVSDQILNYAITFDKSLGHYVLSFETSNEMKSFSITKNGADFVSSATAESNANSILNTAKAYKYDLGAELPNFADQYLVTVEFEENTLAQAADMSSLYTTDEFASQYTYTGELGAIYSHTETTFRVWSPVATKMTLRVYDTGTPVSINKETGSNEHTDYEMTRGANGTWEYNLKGDLEGKYYTYVVTNFKYTDKEIVDPYAKSTGVNGLRGMVVDFEKTNPVGWDSVSIHEIPSTQLTVYETHIADLTSSDTWGGTEANAKKFKGFYEAGTTYTEGSTTVTTGFDHIKELGVNAVQIIPVFDAQNDEVNPTFNWGYNPLNYNSLDGIYSSNPYDGYEKIKEFKSLVQAYNQEGINIIMDVVYNHVNAAEGSNFDVLVPGYYYRYTNGKYSNGSGCGNETASELPMMRKFMIDSTQFWATEYKLGGFRFDLMGVHDLETMNQLSENLHDTYSEYCTVYGEPWSGGGIALSDSLSAKQDNISRYTEYGCFNDKLRDALIKGGLNSKSARGWITIAPSFMSKSVNASNFDTAKASNQLYVKDADGNYTPIASDATYVAGTKYYITITPSVSSVLGDLKNGIAGQVLVSNDPYKCVNYVTCHDNYTLYDRIKAAGITDEDTVKKMAMLANSVVFTSQGITFMLAGEEFLRTKNIKCDTEYWVDNTYNAPYEVNALDYSLKIKNQDMFDNYQTLISLKQSLGIFNYETEAECRQVLESITTSDDGTMISYTMEDDAYTYVVIHCNGVGASSDHVYNLEGYELLLNTLGGSLELTAETQISSYQTIIARKAK